MQLGLPVSSLLVATLGVQMQHRSTAAGGLEGFCGGTQWQEPHYKLEHRPQRHCGHNAEGNKQRVEPSSLALQQRLTMCKQ